MESPPCIVCVCVLCVCQPMFVGSVTLCLETLGPHSRPVQLQTCLLAWETLTQTFWSPWAGGWRLLLPPHCYSQHSLAHLLGPAPAHTQPPDFKHVVLGARVKEWSSICTHRPPITLAPFKLLLPFHCFCKMLEQPNGRELKRHNVISTTHTVGFSLTVESSRLYQPQDYKVYWQQYRL